MQIDLGKKYDMVKGENGVWTVQTEPIEPGFHYYFLVIDGVAVADPASQSFFGTGKMSSGIDIPEVGADFYTVKDVPHGAVSSKYYYSNVTNSWRRLFVYTPPDTIRQGKRGTRWFIFSMEEAKMRPAGLFKAKPISSSIT